MILQSSNPYLSYLTVVFDEQNPVHEYLRLRVCYMFSVSLVYRFRKIRKKAFCKFVKLIISFILTLIYLTFIILFHTRIVSGKETAAAKAPV